MKLQERLRGLRGDLRTSSVSFGVAIAVAQEAADRIDALERESAALRNDFNALQHAIVGDTGASAILTVEALRVDAERYRWLRDKADADNGHPYATIHKANDWGKWFNTWECGEGLDAAIDAAMEQR